jgi:type II secretory pathway pseudopilin PulG
MRRRLSEAGYNLVALTIAVTVLNVLVAAALPMWSTAMQREKEEELVFRGLQYAEGIRLFQRRFGRFPVRLQELIEVEPRCVRKLWKDPMMDDGEWGLIFATPGGQAPGANPNAPNAPNAPGRGNLPGRGPRTPGGEDDGGVAVPEAVSDISGDSDRRSVTVGPIEGVYSRSNESSHLVFLNQETYSAWRFRVALVTGSIGVTNQPGNVLPQLNARWVGRPLPAGVQPPQGNLPGGGGRPGQPGTGLVPGQGGLPVGSPGTNPPVPRRQLPNTFSGAQQRRQ